MPFFERYLTLWVFLCIVAGIALGHFFAAPVQAIGRMQVAQVNMPVAVLIWLMIIPMLLKIDFASLSHVKEHWRGIGVTLFINWAVKPFSMALLAWLFIRVVFAHWLPAAQLDSLGIASITVPWSTLLLSVLLYIVVPVIFSQLWRKRLLAKGGQTALDNVLSRLHPISLLALLATLVLLFGFQGEQILQQPLVIVMLAVPILIQVYFNSGLAYLLNRKFGVAHCVAGPSALIGASNFFELAVAAAISLFGFQSGAALATVVGVLIEVPVMLSVVKIVNASKAWYEKGLSPKA
ncbi:MAG: arsenical-resistance protein [Gammaproteobacteria bacterium]